MIKVGLPSALIYGSGLTEGERRLLSTVYSAEKLQESIILYAKDNDANFFEHFQH